MKKDTKRSTSFRISGATQKCIDTVKTKSNLTDNTEVIERGILLLSLYIKLKSKLTFEEYMELINLELTESLEVVNV